MTQDERVNSDEVGEFVRKLSGIQTQLDTLPTGPSPQRFALLTDQDELRRAAREFAVGHLARRSDEDLASELQALVRQRDGRFKASSGYVTSMGGGQDSPTGRGWVELIVLARGAGDLDPITARISALEDEITRRRATPIP